MDVLMLVEIKRYSRHVVLPEVGIAVLLKLKLASSLVMGAGVLGVPLTEYLVAFGVFRLWLVDFDVLHDIVGSIQAIEAIKLLLGRGDTLIGRLLVFDALRMKFRELKLRKNPECPICGSNPTIKELIDYEEFCGLRGPSEQVGEEFQITVAELKQKIDGGKAVVLLDVREPMEWEIARLDKAVLMPVAQVPSRVNELSTADEIVVYCKTGVRSGRITNFLREIGFRKAKNLVGGIDEWAEKIEPEMARY